MSLLVCDLTDLPLAVVSVCDHAAVGVFCTGDAPCVIVRIAFFSAVRALYSFDPSLGIQAVSCFISVYQPVDPSPAVIGILLCRQTCLFASVSADLDLHAVDPAGILCLMPVGHPL